MNHLLEEYLRRLHERTEGMIRELEAGGGGDCLDDRDPDRDLLVRGYALAQQEEEQGRHSQEEAQLRNSSGTILLLEPDILLSEFISRKLEVYGYKVITAVDVEESLVALREYTGKIEAMLVDTVEPKLDGLRLAKQVLAERPDVSVLLLSGLTMNSALISIGQALKDYRKRSAITPAD